MGDMEKAIAEGTDAPALIQVMATGEEQGHLVPDDLRVEPIEENDVVSWFAAKIHYDLKKWLFDLYWFLLVASVMLVTNHVFPNGGDDHGTVPKKHLITALLAKFALLLCAIYLVLRTMK